MIPIQILAGPSAKPSISPEGFSPSIFTAFVCSYLLKSVPRPLKDTSLWPWIGGGGGGESVHSGELECSFSFPLLWGSCHSISVIQGFQVNPGIGRCLALERWGMACSRIMPTWAQAEPHLLRPDTSSSSPVLSRQSALTFQCALHRPGSQMLILPFIPPSLPVFIKFLQLNTESRLPFNLCH